MFKYFFQSTRDLFVLACLVLLLLKVTISSQAMLEANTYPTVTNVNSIPDSGNGNLQDGEHTNKEISHLIVTFSRAMNNPAGDDGEDDVTNPNNYYLISSGYEGEFFSDGCDDISSIDDFHSVDVVDYNSNTFEAKLTLNEGVPLPHDLYHFFVCGSTGVIDEEGNPLDGDGDGVGGDDLFMEFIVDTTPPFVGKIEIGDENNIDDGDILEFLTENTKILIYYVDPMYNAAGHTEPDDVTNIGNFQVISTGENGEFDTAVCEPISSDDTVIPITNLKYNTPSKFSTLTLNDEVRLPPGTYRVSACNGIRNTAGTFMEYEEGGSSLTFTVPEKTDFDAPFVEQISTDIQEDIQEGDVVDNFFFLHVNFNERLYFPASDQSENSPRNKENYSFKSAGPNGILETAPCGNTLLGDDIEIETSIQHPKSSPRASIYVRDSSVLPSGNYTFSVCGRKTLMDLQGNFLNDGAYNTKFNIIIANTGPTVTQIDIGKYEDVQEGDQVEIDSPIVIQFREKLQSNPDSDVDSPTNPENYSLKSAGPDGVLETAPCGSTLIGDDIEIEFLSIDHHFVQFKTTLSIENADKLPSGNYTISVCGRKTLHDYAGNFLNNGAFNTKLKFIVPGPDSEGPTATQIDLSDNSDVMDGEAVSNVSEATIHFSEAMLNPDGHTEEMDVTNPDNYALKEAGPNGILDTAPCGDTLKEDDSAISINNVAYDGDTHQATLTVNGSTNLDEGSYTLAICGRKTLQDLAGNFFNDGISNDNISFIVVSLDTEGPYVKRADFGGRNNVKDGDIVETHHLLWLYFNEPMLNPIGHTEEGDVTNPENYALKEAGPNGILETAPCADTLQGDDVAIDINAVTYSTETLTADLAVNDYVNLPVGNYTLAVCGRKTLTDLTGNFFNDGVSNYALSYIIEQPDKTGPTVTAVDLGEQHDVSDDVMVNEVTEVAIHFSEALYDPNGHTHTNDVTNPNNYAVVGSGANSSLDTVICESKKADDVAISVDFIDYDETTFTAVIHINSAHPLNPDLYQVAVCGQNTLRDRFGNYFNDGTADFGLRFDVIEEDVTGPSVDTISIGNLLDAGSGDAVLPINSLTIQFSEQMFNPTGSSNPNDVTNPANYALVRSGTNGSIDTAVCGQPEFDDTAVAIDSIAYNDTTFEATIFFNGGENLPESSYQFAICGEGTLQDEAGNFFNNGEGNFAFLFTVTELLESNFTIFLPIVTR